MKRAASIAGIIIILFVSFASRACTKDPSTSNTPKRNIALILKMNSGYHWGTIKMGADTAAREFNVDIDYAAPDDEEDIDGQIKLVDRVLDNKDKKVDALILAAADYNALVGVTEKACGKGIPVIIIDSEVNTKKINSYIATDNLEAGEKAGNILVKLTGVKANVAIMSFVKGTRNAEEREEGLLKTFSAYPGIKVVAKEYCLSNTRLAYTLAKKLILENPNLDAIVALNSISAEGVAQAVDEMDLEGRIKIIAFDSTSREIDYMEKGIIQATVIQNPFSMGYLGVKYAVDALDGKKIEKRIYTDSKVIVKETMYLPENQKLLFPFIK